MPPPLPSLEDRWSDQFAALDFAERRFADLHRSGLLTRLLRAPSANARQQAQPSPETLLPLPDGSGSPAALSLRYWTFLQEEVLRLARHNVFPLARQHALLDEIESRRRVLERRLTPAEVYDVLPAEVLPVEDAAKADEARSPRKPPAPRRQLLEILLDPRNIQWLLGIGGALMVVGLVILLYVNDVFEPPVVAACLGLANVVVLLGGWYLVRRTRYHLAGQALTLIACLVMPLNLWYYQVNPAASAGALTLERNLWVAGVVIALLYLASALVLREPLFVYVQVAGVTLAGLLILATGPTTDRFWEIAHPSTMLVVLGLIAIHLERAFPEGGDGPFTRRRFGMAYFWSGHALLTGGLLMLLGAFVAGDWLYAPWFEPLYRQLATG